MRGPTAALIVQGKIQPPDLAVIVDTEREKSTTWRYMDEVITPALASVGVTLHRVRKSQFEHRDRYSSNGTLLVPVFTNLNGEVGKLSNFCSSYWKREVIKRWATSQGVALATTWLGISTDEMRRIQVDRGDKWRNRYILVEQRMNRNDCEQEVARLGWPKAPRSSCYDCPNQLQREWRDMRDNSPPDWQAAIQSEQELHVTDPHAFLHSDCVPLAQADLEDRNGSLFGHECQSGHCFV